MDPAQSAPKRTLDKSDYLGFAVFATASPLAALWIQGDWVLRQGIRLLQALSLYLDKPILWLVILFEVVLSFTALFLLRGIVHRWAVRWIAFATLCLLWTYMAYVTMPGVHR